MYLSTAVLRLLESPVDTCITRNGFGAAGLYFQGDDKPLRFRRFPNSYGWDWTPTPTELALGEWSLREVRNG